jgi:hypothetical protein
MVCTLCQGALFRRSFTLAWSHLSLRQVQAVQAVAWGCQQCNC